MSDLVRYFPITPEALKQASRDNLESTELDALLQHAAEALKRAQNTAAERPRITIAPSQWKSSGEYLEDDRARLSTRIDINDVTLQLEAYAKTSDEDEFHVADPELDDVLTTLVGDGAYPLQTTTIEGREYILLATPTGA